MRVTTEAVPDTKPDPEARLIEKEEESPLAYLEEMETLTAMVMELPEEERVVMEARYFIGATQTEVAAFLGLSERQVRRREVRAIRRMREAHNEEV